MLGFRRQSDASRNLHGGALAPHGFLLARLQVRHSYFASGPFVASDNGEHRHVPAGRVLDRLLELRARLRVDLDAQALGPQLGSQRDGIGAQIVGPWLAKDLIAAYLGAKFSTAEEFRRRVAKLAEMDAGR